MPTKISGHPRVAGILGAREFRAQRAAVVKMSPQQGDAASTPPAPRSGRSLWPSDGRGEPPQSTLPRFLCAPLNGDGLFIHHLSVKHQIASRGLGCLAACHPSCHPCEVAGGSRPLCMVHRHVQSRIISIEWSASGEVPEGAARADSTMRVAEKPAWRRRRSGPAQRAFLRCRSAGDLEDVLPVDRWSLSLWGTPLGATHARKISTKIDALRVELPRRISPRIEGNHGKPASSA